MKKLNRRTFLNGVGISTAATLWPAATASGFGSAVARQAEERWPQGPEQFGRGRAVEVSGQVTASGRPVAGVPVTDGLQVFLSDEDGEFRFLSSPESTFVYLSIPSNYALPQNPTGTARFYRPLPPGRDRARFSFDLEPIAGENENHRFLLLGDIQTEDAGEMALFHDQTVPDLKRTIRGSDLEQFAFSCGDILFDHLHLYPAYEEGVSQLDLPFFQVIGNHDLDMSASVDLASADTFQSFFGPTHYSFDRGAVHYVVLDDVFWHGDGYIGYINHRQMNWLREDLALVEPGRTVILLLHIPLLSTRYRRVGAGRPSTGLSVQNREALYELLSPYNAHVLSAHTHESEHVFEGGVHEHVHGAVCGAWWTGPICFDGTPNGYTIYDVRGEKLSWQYKATGEELEKQIRVYPRGSDPTAPEEIVANVWNWDPEWTVLWYENGARRGEMARRIGLDPLSVTLHAGTELPPKRPWVEPQPTDHMFFAPATPGRRILVEAIDRFGNVYQEELPGS